jgi:hypothetical protein
MTIYQFDELTDADQAATIWSRGQLVAERWVNGYKVGLYQVESFYAEVYYGVHDVQRIFSFCNTDLLWPYLAKIDISDLQQFR